VEKKLEILSLLTTESKELRNTFIGLLDITKPFLPLAILAGLTQGIQASLMPKPHMTDSKSMQQQLARNMSFQTKYVLPLIIVFIANTLAAAVSLYWVVANTFSILQELYFRKQIKLGKL
jgi:membrane protein insertase Oxa1/YidC/SpoIIIJ